MDDLEVVKRTGKAVLFAAALWMFNPQPSGTPGMPFEEAMRGIYPALRLLSTGYALLLLPLFALSARRLLKNAT